MLSIKSSVEHFMWEQAAEALASALSVLPRDQQLSLAKSLLEHVEKVILEADKGIWKVGGLKLPSLPKPEDDDSHPWSAHLADAQDEVEKILADPPRKDAAFSSRIAAALWDAVMGLQVAAWAATDRQDFQNWRLGREAKGVFGSHIGNEVGVNHWLQIDKRIKEHAQFVGKKDDAIYSVRPAVHSLGEIVEGS